MSEINVLVADCGQIPRNLLERSAEKSGDLMGVDIQLNFLDAPTEDDVIRNSPLMDVIIGTSASENLLNSARRLKLFQIPDHDTSRFNLKIFESRPRIFLCSCHGTAVSVAETAMAAIFCLSKRICHKDRNLRKGVWVKGDEEEFLSFDVREKRLGIIGLGNVGKELAKMAYMMGMKVCAVRRRGGSMEDGISPFLEFIEEKENLTKVIHFSDFIAICVPNLTSTRNLISLDELKLMQDKYVLQLSHPDCIDEKAFFEKLESEFISGAYVDQWKVSKNAIPDSKVLPSEYPFHKLDNVILSPFSAGLSFESLERSVEIIVNNIISIHRNKDPEGKVNYHLGY